MNARRNRALISARAALRWGEAVRPASAPGMSGAMTRPQAVSGRIVSSQFVALPSVLWISRCVGASGQVASAVRKCTLLPQTSTVWLRIPAQRGDRSPQSLHFISQVSRPGPRQSQLALHEGL